MLALHRRLIGALLELEIETGVFGLELLRGHRLAQAEEMLHSYGQVSLLTQYFAGEESELRKSVRSCVDSDLLQITQDGV